MSENAKPVAWALLTADGTLALCDRRETYVTLRRERYDEGWPECAPHTVTPLYAHPTANSHQPVPSDQTAPVPPVVACGCNGRDTVCLAHAGTVPSMVTVTDEMVEAARAVIYQRAHIAWVKGEGFTPDADVARAALAAALRPERGEGA